MAIRNLHRWALAALSCCALLGLAPAAEAQSSSPQGSLEAATSKGADRQQRLGDEQRAGGTEGHSRTVQELVQASIRFE